MNSVPNSTNSNYESAPLSDSSGPAFSGNALFRPLTYKDFLPNDTAKLRSTQKKTGSNAWFNSTFKGPIYKDFMPQHPSSNKKNMSVSAWIGSILGGTIGISLLGFFGRAHFNGGLLKDGIKNTWNDFTKRFGITSKRGTGGTSSTRSSSSTSSQVPSGILNQRLVTIKTQFNPGHVFTTQELRAHFFQEDSKQFQQRGSNLCYALAGLGAMRHHPAFDKFLEKFTITRRDNGFDINIPGKTKKVHVSDDEILDKNPGFVSSSIGAHVYIEALMKCEGSTKNRDIMDDSLDALKRIFGDKGESRIREGVEKTIRNKDELLDYSVTDHEEFASMLQALQKLHSLPPEKLNAEEGSNLITELNKKTSFITLRKRLEALKAKQQLEDRGEAFTAENFNQLLEPSSYQVLNSVLLREEADYMHLFNSNASELQSLSAVIRGRNTDHEKLLQMATSIEQRLKPKANAGEHQVEQHPFNWNDKVREVNNYLQWLRRPENHDHLALLTAHRGPQSGNSGHYYTVLPHESEDGHIYLMNPFSMGRQAQEPSGYKKPTTGESIHTGVTQADGTVKQMAIEEFFRQGLKLNIFFENAKYPGPNG